MATVVIHLGTRVGKDGEVFGLYCTRASIRYGWTGHAVNTMNRQRVTCKRCLAKLGKHS